MAATDLEKKAKEAFFDDDFELAVDLYSQAIDMDPKNADLFADRAQANIKINNFTEAVADASKAIELDPSMSKAYLRKGTACIKLEEYQTAKTALEAGLKLASGDSRFIKLIKECDERIAEETISLRNKVIPYVTNAVSPALIGSSVCSGSTLELPTPAAVQASSKPKYRHDYYNSPTEVVLTVFAKGIPADHVSVDFGEQTLMVVISLPGEEPYRLQLRLFGKIIPEKCRYMVLSTKIEIRLTKAEEITWMSLEFSNKKTVPTKINTVPDSAVAKQQRPSYPSSKSKIDWDKLEAQVKKEEKEEKLDGDAALNKLFHDIYRDADEDTKRAMRKSFVESNGTVLSTNWKDVGAKKVEGSPPEGMELKKWEY